MEFLKWKIFKELNDEYKVKLSTNLGKAFVSVYYGKAPWSCFWVKRHWGKIDYTAGASVFFRFDENKVFGPKY
ncbi:hypothetical protein COV93_08985 [Candidatus Woesearchaeota archaeon CG11_big_fil_rev_8_21_14_0_20_43_8]|nr:MAG: hypothetical protein COV93_08985 [Candidatus Woesearchaeota archaeon CG11_big_fil_rev_8_21_14_0_20_43_8]PIO04600.1 MAG: hypothetical protein COT47_08275 [Candidatus Woesearchaeota archaeon CG08_land_8_20_14_0_20_43_7]